MLATLNRISSTKMGSDNCHIVVACRNAGQAIVACLESLSSQKYQRFNVIVYDDASDDGTRQLVQRWAAKDARFSLIKGQERCGAALARWRTLQSLQPGSVTEVVIIIDGDDWLKDDSSLARIVHFQKSGRLLASHGNYETEIGDVCTWAKDYAPEVKRSIAFRDAPWIATHPRAFRAGLIPFIPERDMWERPGIPFFAATDFALFVNILELVGELSAFNSDVTYVYNTRGGTHLSGERLKEQRRCEELIRCRPRNLPLTNSQKLRMLSDIP